MDSDDAEDDNDREIMRVDMKDMIDDVSEYHEVNAPQKLAEWILFKGTLEEGRKTISQDFCLLS